MDIEASFKQKNPAWMKQFRRTIKKLESDKLECAVGFPQGKGAETPWYDSGESILEVAIQNEYGLPAANIPARPFMQQSGPKIQEAYDEAAGKAGEAIMAGELDVDTFLEAAGQQSVGIIQDTIATGSFAPNAPYTIAKKGSSVPLIDSGDMRKFVTYVVRESKE
jgi:hypothetical protein